MGGYDMAACEWENDEKIAKQCENVRTRQADAGCVWPRLLGDKHRTMILYHLRRAAGCRWCRQDRHALQQFLQKSKNLPSSEGPRWHQALTKARLTIKHLHNRIFTMHRAPRVINRACNQNGGTRTLGSSGFRAPKFIQSSAKHPVGHTRVRPMAE